MQAQPKSADKKKPAREKLSSQSASTGNPELSVFAQSMYGSGNFQSAAGNLAIQRFLTTGLIQAKLSISQPGDGDEEEADRIAKQVVSPGSTPIAQKQCECGQSSGGNECLQCSTENSHVQRKPIRRAPASTVSPSALRLGIGRSLDATTRDFMKSHFGSGIDDVRIHTDDGAAKSAAAIDADAFTIGRDIVFGAGRYAPTTVDGKQLLAHELTHVFQQQKVAPDTVQRQPAVSGSSTTTPSASATPSPGSPKDQKPMGDRTSGLILDDSAEDVQPTQMKRSQFLSQLRSAGYGAAEQALAGSSWALVARPRVKQQLELLFNEYGGQDNLSLERSIRQQVVGASGATSASAFIPLIAEEVRRSVTDGLPKDETGTGMLDTGLSTISGISQTVIHKLSDLGSILFKANSGGPKLDADPRAVKAQLHGGQALDDTMRARMEAVFGHDFSHVRIHTGTKAAELSSGLNSRAFTIGSDIAFNAGEYRPETPIGEALVAHELAHVAQQRNGGSNVGFMPQGTSEQNALEEDADIAAVGAVVSLWSGTKDTLSRIGRNAVPALRSGLRLQRCTKEKPEIGSTQQEMGKRIQEKMASINSQKQSLDAGIWYWPEYRQACESDPTGTHKWDEAKYRLGYTVAPQFTKTGDFLWTLNSGASASAAIQAWLRGLTVADCASAATAIYYDTLRAAVGNKKFDEYFAAKKGNEKRQLLISQYPKDTPLIKFLYEPERKEGLVEGDWYYWKNHPMYKYKHPRGLWQGENSVYLGNASGEDKWAGFGAGGKTNQQMLQVLLNEYNADRTPDDLRRLEEIKQEHAGTLPAEYVYSSRFPEKLGDNPQVIVQAGGGLQELGWRLNVLSVTALKES
jgi:hypothetical protein